ncbi:5901_t:CDS:2 [Ambispora gerdemannii]|uniref:5901_t:CDS:1 n=1 Tax=Ambispora gerdemannii TaxID=144530 RepID=A0A9N8W6P7_9GLOM|nr:5901_t:CDS:2 [Ambispora gerdemannii]
MLLIPHGKTIEETLTEHQSSKCTLHLLSGLSSTIRKKCKLSECKSVNEGDAFVFVICDGCGEMFCLKHRYPASHQCCSLTVASDAKAKRRAKAEEIKAQYLRASKADSQSKITSKSSLVNITTNPINDKPKKKTSKIVEVMKLKSKAQGDESIPHDSRIYLCVHFPRDSKLSPKPLFFNKNWATGKVLDRIAITGKINNTNNQLTFGDPNFLLLYNKETGQRLEMDKKLGDLIESGGELLLERQGAIIKILGGRSQRRHKPTLDLVGDIAKKYVASTIDVPIKLSCTTGATEHFGSTQFLMDMATAPTRLTKDIGGIGSATMLTSSV